MGVLVHNRKAVWVLWWVGGWVGWVRDWGCVGFEWVFGLVSGWMGGWWVVGRPFGGVGWVGGGVGGGCTWLTLLQVPTGTRSSGAWFSVGGEWVGGWIRRVLGGSVGAWPLFGGGRGVGGWVSGEKGWFDGFVWDVGAP